MQNISSDQMTALLRDDLKRTKSDIVLILRREFPIATSRMDEPFLARFVQEAMTACRTVWIDDAALQRRFVRIAFILEYVHPEKAKLQYFTRIMMSEDTADARLRFAEEHLI